MSHNGGPLWWQLQVRIETRSRRNHMLSERHWSVAEIAKRWNVSPKTVREMFRSEPGVLKIERPERCSKRSYTTLRIPESVLLRVEKRLKNGGR